MTEEIVMDTFREGILLTMKLAAPILIVSILIGLVIAIFQAATQIHEQTLTFVPKLLVIGLMLLSMGSWMISIMTDFVELLFQRMIGL